MGNNKNNHINTVGLPEFFATHQKMEDMGNGLVRVIRGIYRRGKFQPIYTTIQAAPDMLRAGKELEEMAMRILRGDGWAH